MSRPTAEGDSNGRADGAVGQKALGNSVELRVVFKMLSSRFSKY